MHDLRGALQKKIQKMPVSYFDEHAFGDVLSCVTNDVDTLSKQSSAAWGDQRGGC